MDEEVSTSESLARVGAVRYMDAPALQRGVRMSRYAIGAIVLFALAALLVGAVFGLRLNNAIINAPARFQESLEEAIGTGASLELPTLASYVDSDSAAIREAIDSAGYVTIDVDAMYADQDEIDPDSIDLVKVPADMDYDTAVGLFTGSLRRADLVQAAHFLASTWRFTSYQAEGIDLKVKYADFQSSSLEEAIANAVAQQGWSDSTFGETGVDQSGNTYQNGTVQVNDRTLNWSVSVCPLDEVYNVNGLPEDSFYVGVRLVQ